MLTEYRFSCNIVKCSCEVLGIIQLARDWNLQLEGSVFVDSSAALGVVARKGAGKLRHVRVGQLWVHEKSERGELHYEKVKGTNNPADAMTKLLARADLNKCCIQMSHEAREGRADKSFTTRQ